MMNYDPNRGRNPRIGGFNARYLDDSPIGGLFGGGLTSGGDATVDQASTLTAGQGDLLSQLVSLLSGQLGQGVNPFQGQRVAGVSPLQQQAFGAAGGALPLAQQAFGFGTSMPQQFGQAQDQLTKTLQDFDPQSTISNFAPARDIANRNFQNITVPSILERFAGAGGVNSSAAPQAVAEAGRDLSLGLSGQLGQLLQQGEQNQLNRQQAGIGQALQVGQAPLNFTQQAGQTGLGLLQGMAGFGQQQRGIEQQQLGAEQNRFNEGQAFNNPFLNLLPLGLGTDAFENIVTPPGPSLLEQIGPIVGAAAAACDRNLKEDITPIENALEKVSGLQGFEYKFKPLGDRRAGIMAQDLEDVMPSAVIEVEGIKMVKLDSVIGLLVSAVNELHDKIKEN